MNLTFLKPLVAQILRDQNTSWSVQGFGMMRAYFGPPDNPKEFRLNLWDSRLAVPNVSTIHDHPWHFESVVVAGHFTNQRYDLRAAGVEIDAPTHQFTTIKTGEGGGMEKSPILLAQLHPYFTEVYQAGDRYSQNAEEIHETIYTDGCVTLNKRTRVGDGEHARVFWPHWQDWVDAEPRPATPVEIAAVTENALRGF